MPSDRFVFFLGVLAIGAVGFYTWLWLEYMPRRSKYGAVASFAVGVLGSYGLHPDYAPGHVYGGLFWGVVMWGGIILSLAFFMRHAPLVQDFMGSG